ncbi:hypothetical protein BKA82DRAFT_191226 [Pisolithus tinctorius]|uniref:Uncharacterized protein n=1 Tax=Pisolithus tinctorius Marx 270 TaxID=870435 RepID=A0A0C3PZL4_PISTI|nr:hypothetical protein BKA82DRAFT_191226 [Pisolithus tinctorius]KIO14889.1 hypothetical protein M404DRAFT_191226 [Pisolithus tinctorius Marx 270]
MSYRSKMRFRWIISLQSHLPQTYMPTRTPKMKYDILHSQLVTFTESPCGRHALNLEPSCWTTSVHCTIRVAAATLIQTLLVIISETAQRVQLIVPKLYEMSRLTMYLFQT